MADKHKNVVTEIVGHGMCDGCGVCTGICPSGALMMKFNGFGEYTAVESGSKCSENCRMCLMVCPFSDCSENEDVSAKELFVCVVGIRNRPETGFYLDSFSGYSMTDGHRANGASGGLATWMLETLLKTGEVDHIACVSRTKEPDRLFKFAMCSDPEKVRACSKSCYYPAGVCRIIEEILANEGHYAITGLPCVIRALRSAIRLNKKLRERIKFLLGLVCGQGKSKFFAEYLCSLAGGDPARLKEVVFRKKDALRCAADYGAKLVWQDRNQCNNREAVVFWSEGMGEAWVRRYFTLNSCDYCDDLFAELADATFMDAWLPEYIADPGGTNFVIVRNPKLIEIFHKGMQAKRIKLDNIDIQSVIRSQRSALDVKKKKIAYRLALAAKLGQNVHGNRAVLPKKVGFFELVRIYIQRQITRKSRIAFKKQKVAGPGLKVFRLKIGPWIVLARIEQKIERLWDKIKRFFIYSYRVSA
jgi:coenzyme F420-reducing hydrogenase beta subunit